MGVTLAFASPPVSLLYAPHSLISMIDEKAKAVAQSNRRIALVAAGVAAVGALWYLRNDKKTDGNKPLNPISRGE